MRVINEDIELGKYKRVYLIYGEEGYLRRQYRDKLKDAITAGNTMNYGYFEGKDIEAEDIIEMSETLPFLAEHRLIVVENSGFFKNANEKMAEYIEKIPESSIIVFVETEIDKRGSLYKRVNKYGYASEMAVQEPKVLEKWVLDILGRNGKKISRETMNYFMSVAGNDMTNMYNEIEKLVCYCMDKEIIEISDIKSITTEQISAKIFDMIDAMGFKNRKKALDIYYDLINTKEPPMRILFMLTRQFNIMLQVKELNELRVGQADMASRLSLHPYAVGKAVKQMKNFGMQTLRAAINDAVNVEKEIKSGNMNEKIGVETLLITYSV